MHWNRYYGGMGQAPPVGWEDADTMQARYAAEARAIEEARITDPVYEAGERQPAYPEVMPHDAPAPDGGPVQPFAPVAWGEPVDKSVPPSVDEPLPVQKPVQAPPPANRGAPPPGGVVVPPEMRRQEKAGIPWYVWAGGVAVFWWWLFRR